jgi:hypothetical protein
MSLEKLKLTKIMKLLYILTCGMVMILNLEISE